MFVFYLSFYKTLLISLSYSQSFFLFLLFCFSFCLFFSLFPAFDCLCISLSLSLSLSISFSHCLSLSVCLSLSLSLPLFHALSDSFIQVDKRHLWRDQYHVHHAYSYLMAQTTAAAIVDVNPYDAFNHPKPLHYRSSTSSWDQTSKA